MMDSFAFSLTCPHYSGMLLHSIGVVSVLLTLFEVPSFPVYYYDNLAIYIVHTTLTTTSTSVLITGVTVSAPSNRLNHSFVATCTSLNVRMHSANKQSLCLALMHRCCVSTLPRRVPPVSMSIRSRPDIARPSV